MKKILLTSLLLTLVLGCSGKEPVPEPVGPRPDPAGEPATEHYVSSAAELKALGKLPAGSVVVWRNGLYADQVVDLSADGTAGNPVVLRAETPGRVLFTGTSRITVTGSGAEVSGFWWRNPSPVAGKAVVTLAKGSSGCTLHDCAVTGDDTREDAATDCKWVSLYGTGHRVERCTFRDKRNIGTLLVVWLEAGIVPRHVIAGNAFTRPVTLRDAAGKAINGQETIRIGTSEVSMQEAACTVEENYFYHCHGEQAEIVSNKSCGNTYRRNLFVECQGSLTLRHGNGCLVTGNCFVGNDLEGTGGVRIIGERHTVEYNYFERLAGTGYRTALCIVRGQQNAALSGYWQVKEAVVRGNTFVDCKYGLNVNYASNGGSQVLPVVSTAIEQNTVIASASGSYAVSVTEEPAPKLTWRNNKIYGRLRGVSLPTLPAPPARPDVQAAMNAMRDLAGCAWIDR